MNAYVNLFKALPVKTRTESVSFDYIDHGVLVEDSVAESYSQTKIKQVIKTLVPSNSQMNKTFHKSWKKVRDASMEQLVTEQLLHYFTTYGFESLGIYSEGTVFIPNEELKLEGEGGVTFYVLRGITPDEASEAVQRIVASGMALSDTDLDDLVSVIKEQKLPIDPAKSANREMSVRLYDLLGVIPKDPVEYLRLQVYRAVGSTMLIKSRSVIKAISEKVNTDVFSAYEYAHGINGLASIFYRFKPLFLAFKNDKSASTVNRIRRLAVKHHRPMKEDYLASVTKHLRKGTFDAKSLHAGLEKANVFRKVKLAQALRFYGNEDVSGVVYSVRNGRSFATKTAPVGNVDEALSITLDSLAKDLRHLQGKRMYMDANLTVPTSGKMFCGSVPFGSSFSTEESLALGVSWKDLPGCRVDLDLSMIAVSGKTGWDGVYRNGNLLFSGDITAAPNGATEAHLVRAGAADGIYLLNLNFFNAYQTQKEVPYTLFVTKENEYKRMNFTSMVSQDKMLFWTDSVISVDCSQKTIGVLKVEKGVKTFYAFESNSGRSMSAYRDESSLNTIDYYDKYLDSQLDLRGLLGHAGVEFVDDPEEADVDLSLAAITKDSLIQLFTAEV